MLYRWQAIGSVEPQRVIQEIGWVMGSFSSESPYSCFPLATVPDLLRENRVQIGQLTAVKTSVIPLPYRYFVFCFVFRVFFLICFFSPLFVLGEKRENFPFSPEKETLVYARIASLIHQDFLQVSY